MPDLKPAFNPEIANSGEPLLVDLSDRGLIHVSGGDASRFLQNQLTNDINKVNTAQGQLAAWCTAKGRMLVIFRIFCPADGEYLLELPASLLESIIKRLRMFVLRSDVTLSADDTRTSFAVCGDIAHALESPPQGDYAQIVADKLSIMRIPGEIPRYQIAGPADALRDARARLAQKTRPASGDLWRWLDIQAGQPSVWPQTQERFTPHMLNLDLLGGVSFEKGCYPGQEIVARTQFLGKVKQRMVRGKASAEAGVHRGDAIFIQDTPRQAAGYVVDTVQTPDSCDLLVTVKHAASQNTVRLGEAGGPVIELMPPPYSMTE